MHIHILGICGTFMGGLAQLARAAGHQVSGCDAGVYPPMSTQLQAAGIALTEGYDAGQTAIKPDIFVIGNAISRGNPLLEAILEQNLPFVSGPQWLAEHILRGRWVLGVAGTHGKTTTSTMAAHLLHQSHVGCTAFLGGISKNYGTNLLLSATSPYTVIEADEFDRSFHWLSPWMSVITATDPDHLDIYGTKEAYLESFRHYTTLIQPGGALILHKGLEMQADVQPGVTTYTYSRNEGDFHAENIRIGNGEIFIDFVAPDTRINDIQLGVPVSINIENGVAAMALAHLSGATDEEIKQGMASFRGVDRRFDFKLKNDRIVFLSDYAHHPAEIAQSVKSVRELYQDKKITVIFQPHLYTRTRDFYRDFADSLSLSDEVILTEIYPAREQPIPGVTSQLIYDNLRPGIEKCICRKEDVLSLLAQKHTEVLVVLGAGDLDNYAPQITQLLSEKYHG